MTDITSASNEKVKYVRSLAQKKNRQKYREYTVEGIKSVSDALKSKAPVSALYVSDMFYSGNGFKYPHDVPLYRVPDTVFEKMCDTKAPQGILAVIRMTDDTFICENDGAYIYCDGIKDPGNLGTIIRTADAAGMRGVMLSPECVDLYNPKTVRASMGSLFNIPVMSGIDTECLRELYESGFNIIGGALSDDSADYRTARMQNGTVIVVGNEANGISDDIMNLCKKVKIPILGGAESLNAAVAAAILMYEYVRRAEGGVK